MRPTDNVIAALLLRASWQVQGVGFQLSADERERMALDMRELAQSLLPVSTAVSYETAPTERRHGHYTGD